MDTALAGRGTARDAPRRPAASENLVSGRDAPGVPDHDRQVGHVGLEDVDVGRAVLVVGADDGGIFADGDRVAKIIRSRPCRRR